jgi:hypothetical protein
MEGYFVPEHTGPGIGLNEVCSCTSNPFSPTPPLHSQLHHVTRFESVPSYPNKLVFDASRIASDSVHWSLVYTRGSQSPMRGVSTCWAF